MSDKSQKLESLLQRAASEFLARESNRSSLITVTNVRLRERGRKADVLISIFPDAREEQALDFLNRKKKEFGEYLTKNTRLQYLPSVSFLIDMGEKNRQRLEKLLQPLPTSPSSAQGGSASGGKEVEGQIIV